MESKRKYAAPLNAEAENDSRAMILRWVEKGSTVLEFGCAYGQMTRYMRDELGCRVYIVEYNPQSYEEAVQYAEDGVCGDILQWEWLEKFQNVGFDRILFTDVLEHLSNPLDALRNAKKLLKPEGKILASIPNTAHNDVVSRLLHGQLDYTEEGLLDETHIHLFTFDSLKKMLRAAGCSIEELQYTRRETGTTEQRDERDGDYRNILLERPDGEIYQFIVKIVPEKNAGGEWKLPDCVMPGGLYVDDGNGFREELRYPLLSDRTGSHSYLCEADAKILQKHVQSFRFDMEEGQSCILERLQATVRDSDGVEMQSFRLEKRTAFLSDDPYMELPLEAEKGDVVSLRASFVTEGREMLCLLPGILKDGEAQLTASEESRKQEKNRYKLRLEETQGQISVLQEEKTGSCDGSQQSGER